MEKTKEKSNNKIWTSLFFILFLFLFSAQNIFAQESEGEGEKVTVRVLANVGIDDAKITKQKENNFYLSFKLSNEGQAQPGVTYSVQLLERGVDEKTVVWDEKIYSETASLSENETVSREIVYEAPAYLKGSYELWMFSKNTSGLLFSLVKVGDVILNGDGKFVEINPSSCFLKIEGKEDRFFIKQGVDILENEKIILYCTVINHFNNKLSLTPNFENHFRHTGGEIVESEKLFQEEFDLFVGENKEISLIIPKANKPQAYDAILRLTSQGKSVSNFVAVHYVIRGESGTIQNLRADKEFYAKGEAANLKIDWTSSADGFFGARLGMRPSKNNLSVNVSMTDDRFAKCAEPIGNNVSSSNHSLEMAMPIIVDCYNPQITVGLVSASGKVLDSRVFDIRSKNQRIEQGVKIEPEKKSATENYGFLKYSLVFFVVIIFAIILLILRKYNIKTKLLLLSIIVSFSLFCAVEKVQAGSATIEINIAYRDWGCLETASCMTFDYSDPHNNCLCYQQCVINKCNLANCGVDEEGEIIDCSASGKADYTVTAATYTASLNKTNYNPSEQIQAFGSYSFNACGNGNYQRGLRQFKLDATQISKSINQIFFGRCAFALGCSAGIIPFANRYEERYLDNIQKNYTADVTPGAYNMRFSGLFQGYLRDNLYVPSGGPAIGTALIPYNVNPPVLPDFAVKLTAENNSGPAPLSGVDLTVTLSSISGQSFPDIGETVGFKFDCDNEGGEFSPPSKTIEGIAPQEYTFPDVCNNYIIAGTHAPSVDVTVGSLPSRSDKDLVTVTTASTNGCGTANGKEYCEESEINLADRCPSGIIAGDIDFNYMFQSFRWTCEDSSGNEVSCSADQKCPSSGLWKEIAPEE